ncbi:hypothetical protein ACA910_008223 [Epithemia clementina (nom. ined.)]
MNEGYSSSPHESESEDDHHPKRAYIPIARKIELVLEAEQSVKKEQKISQNKFCEQNGIAPCQLRGWKKNLANLKKTLDKTTKKKTLKVCTRGRPSRLENIRDKIMPWISGMIAGGKTIKVRRVAIECKRLEKSFRWMKRYTLFAMVQRFLRANGVVLRSVTHKAQDDPKAKQETALAFLGTTRPLLSAPNRSKAFIINMDQTPYNPKESDPKTLAFKGSKTVNAKEMKTSVGRIIALLGICADGTKLPPLFVFKGSPGGSIQREFATFPNNAHYIMQKNAWTDERVMLHWVETVLKPYVERAPAGIVPYLILDKYSCHYQGSVANQIEDLGVEWDIIPGRCTGLVQPIDVGISKPWKYRVRNHVENWMLKQTTIGFHQKTHEN